MLASRLPIATGWGGFLSLVMFWVLWTLINAPIDVGNRAEATRIEFTRQLIDSTIATIRRVEKPTRKPPPDVPQGPTIPVPKTSTTAHPMPPLRPTIETGPRIDGPTVGSDQDATPKVRINPRYPAAAERRGIEGWVEVQFSVTATGMVTDLVVVDSSPAGVFEEETLRAVQRWRYSPKVEDGVAVERVGLQTVIVFELQE